MIGEHALPVVDDRGNVWETSGGRLDRCWCGQRQRYGEGAAGAAPLARHADGAAVRLDECPHDRQPQPGAARIAVAGAVGAVEAVEEIRQMRRFDTCLLYTSPSPRDRTRSRMPSSA